jgi:hypothetical protein
MQKFLFAAVVIIATVLVILKVASDQFREANDKLRPSSISTVQPAIPTASAIVAATPSWDYETVDRDAGARKVRAGWIQSDDQIRLESPYENTFARLCFRSDGGVWLSIASGQLLTGKSHDARIRFSNSAPRSFSLEQPSDYSSDAAFIVPSGPVFAAARGGKKIAVEATYYEAGLQTATFSPNSPLVLK